MSAFTYRYRKEGINKVPVEVAAKVCQNCIDMDGFVSPEKLVDISRPADAPLHPEFEWNDGVAAEMYRKEQARMLIKNIVRVEVVEDENDEHDAQIVDNNDRAFVPTGEQKHQYVTLDDVLTHEKWRENLLKAARKDLIAFRAKYTRLTELAQIMDDIDRFLSA